jgi:hypothetical protein
VEEASEEEHVLGLLAGQGFVLWGGVPDDREAGVDLEPCARPRRERADGAEDAGADEECPAPAGSDGGGDHTGVQFAEVLEPAEALKDVLERLEAVAKPCCLLVAEVLAQVDEVLPKAWQWAVGEELLELFRPGARKCTGGEPGLPAAADRAEQGRGLGDDELLAPASQVDAPVLLSAAGVGGRLKFSNQPELFEGRLELGTEYAPLDALEREQRRLDRRALGFALEVRTQACAQVAGTADVEHPVVTVTEEVHPGPRRRAAQERTLAVHTPLAGSGESAQLGNAAGPQLLRKLDETDEDLGGRLRVGQRPVAGSGRDSEELGEGGEADPALAACEQAAGERCGTQRWLSQPAALAAAQLPLEEALVEPGIVRDQGRVAGEGKEATDDGSDRRRAAQLPLVQPRQPGNRLGEGDTRIDQGLKRIDESERPHPDRAQLADSA